MRRRAFLGSVGLAALAGCGGAGSGEGSTDQPTATGTGTRTGDPTPTAAFPFEFVGVDAASEVPLNAAFAFAVRVRNTGDQERTFTSPLSLKVGDGEWRELDGEVNMTLQPGEMGEWRSPRAVSRYLETFRYRLEAFDETWSIEIVPRQLSFGDRYISPPGLFINVLGGRFTTTYPDPEDVEDGGPTPEDAPAGTTWLVLSVDIRNPTNSNLESPNPQEFVVTVGEETYLPDHQDRTTNPYERIALDPQDATRGELVYAVPEGTTAADIEVTWERSLPGGDVKTVWTK